MALKQAKTFDDDQFDKFLKFIDKNSTLPARDRLMAMLSFKAGLRASEIAKIDLSAMTLVDGKKIAPTIKVFSNVGKNEKQREVPMHPEIRKALADFMKAFPGATYVAISSRPFRHAVRYNRPLPTTYERASVDAVTRYLNKLYKKAGFDDASTHSGRRTFGTKAARVANQHHCSLRDVQMLLGHSRLETTERYLEPSPDSVDLVAAL